jgi:hypothetical protein
LQPGIVVAEEPLGQQRDVSLVAGPDLQRAEDGPTDRGFDSEVVADDVGASSGGRRFRVRLRGRALREESADLLLKALEIPATRPERGEDAVRCRIGVAEPEVAVRSSR